MRRAIRIREHKRLKLSALFLIIFAPFLKKYFENTSNSYPVVGRNSEVDLGKYQTKVLGRNVIDYEKIKHDKPDLYKRIIDYEKESNSDDRSSI